MITHMKRFYSLVIMTLVALALQATVAEEPFLHFGLTSYEGWTYHRAGVDVDQNFISQGRVNAAKNSVQSRSGTIHRPWKSGRTA